MGGIDAEKSDTKKMERKIIEDYSEADLNENPEGGKVKEDYNQQRGGAQQVRCESQWVLFIWIDSL